MDWRRAFEVDGGACGNSLEAPSTQLVIADYISLDDDIRSM
jgi:hypothetical protein